MNNTIQSNQTQELIDIFTNKYGEDINNWDWKYISQYRYLTEDFIREFKDKVNWDWISSNQELSESFIRKFQDKVNWDWISVHQRLSESFIREFKDKVFWNELSFNQKLSEDFIREFKDKVNWKCISYNQKLSKEFLEEFKDKINLKEYYLYNPYANLQDKIKYMRKYGYIEQFDPNKHLLQNSENPKENKDLQLFKELIQ